MAAYPTHHHAPLKPEPANASDRIRELQDCMGPDWTLGDDGVAWICALLDAAPSVRFLICAPGEAGVSNRHWNAEFAIPLREVLAEAWRPLTHRDDQDEIAVAWHAGLAAAQPFSMTARLRHRSGAWRWQELHLEPLSPTGGEPQGWLGTVNDVDELRVAREAALATGQQLEAVEQARRHAEEERLRLRELIEASPDMVTYAMPDGQIEFMNRAARAARGIAPEGALPRVSMPSRHPGWASELLREVAVPAAMRDGMWLGESAVLMADGSEVPVSQLILAHRDAQGHTRFLSTVCRDISEQRRMEDALRQSEASLHALLEILPIGVGIADAQGRTISLNRSALRLHGFQTLGEMLVRLSDYQEQFELFYPDGRLIPNGEWPLVRAMRGDFVSDFPLRIQRRGQAERHALYSVMPMRDELGEIHQYVFLIHDVTSRMQAEESVRRSEERYRLVNLATHDVIWDWELLTGHLEWNDAVIEHFGVTQAELGNHISGWHDRIHEEDRARVIGLVEEAIANGTQTWSGEYRFRKSDGTYSVFLDRGFIARDEAGRAYRMIGSMLDLTERRQAEERLELARREAEGQRRLLDAILDSLPVGVIIANPDGSLIRWNRANEQLWGLRDVPPPRSGCIEDYVDWKGWWPDTGVRLKPHEWALARALLHCEVIKGELIEIERFDGSGHRFMMNMGAPVLDDAGNLIAAVAAQTDVTDQIHAEQALRESEEKFRTLADNILQLAWMTDETGWIFWYNQRWFEYTGTTMETMQGWGWQQVHHPNHVERVVKKFRQHIAGGQVWEDTFPLRSANGEYRWFLSRAFPIRNKSGRVVRWFGTNTDITDQRQAEEDLRRSRDELEERVRERTTELQRRADQLAMMASQLTLAEQRERRRLAQVLHDHLQQLLVGAKFGLDVLSRRVDKPQHEAVDQIYGLINESIQVSRSLTVELSPPILHEGGLAAGLEWLARWMKEKQGLDVALTIDTRASTDREDVRVLVFQAVRELLFNVVKHANVTQAKLELGLQDEDHLRVTLADQGRGFDPARLASGNDHLQSGYGLFSIRERLALLGGWLEVVSSPGSGARFTLVAPMRLTHAPLPIAFQAPVTSPTPTHVAPSDFPPRSGRIRLLLADDHAVMRQGLSALLSDEDDIEVVGEASDGDEALDLARELQPDVVLMDFSMPRMNGVDATRAVCKELPHVQVIGLSMYEEPDRAAAMTEAGAAAYLAKSGDSGVLVDTIRGVYARRKS